MPAEIEEWRWMHLKRIEAQSNNLKYSEIKQNIITKLLTQVLNQQLIGDEKPKEVDDWGWVQIKNIETLLQRVNNQSEKHEQIFSLLNSLLKSEPIGETQPLLVNDWEWTQIKNFESLLVKLRDVENLAEQNKAAALEIAEDRIQVSRLKEKLERQLRFIHELLHDPTLIDRVEEHDDTFAVGNWEILQKVARLLSKPRR